MSVNKHYQINYKGYLIAGIDEAGRGPLAGPVIAAAVILDPHNPIEGLTDSKKISAKKREKLSIEIKEKALSFGIGRAEALEIDNINILQASLLAMQRAFENLTITPEYAIVDGNFCPKLTCKTQAIIKGDLYEPAISAASILAKVTRDAELIELDLEFPLYGFASHKGYPTKAHIEALKEHGISSIHRKSYAPVKKFS